MAMRKELKESWIAALRGGQFKHGVGSLLSFGDEYCCFGVLCRVAGIDEADWVRLYSVCQGPTIMESLGVSDESTISYYERANDDPGDAGQKGFNRIADMLEADESV